jgi:hypothetical protein
MYPEDMINRLKELNGGREEVSLASANHGLPDISSWFESGGATWR